MGPGGPRGPGFGPRAQIRAQGGPNLDPWAQIWARMVGPSLNPNLGPGGGTAIGNLGENTSSCAAKNRAERTGQNSKRRHMLQVREIFGACRVGLIVTRPRPDMVHHGAPFGIPTWEPSPWIPCRASIWDSHMGIPYGDPMWGSHMGIPQGNPRDLGFWEWCPLKDF